MKREYPQIPMIGVGGVIIKDKQVLLIKRKNPPRAGEWSIPGGLQQLGETVFQALVREVAEETGLKVKPKEILDVIDMINKDQDGRIRYHYTLIDIWAEWEEGLPNPQDDALEAAFFPLEQISQLGLWSETLRIIELAAGKYVQAGSY